MLLNSCLVIARLCSCEDRHMLAAYDLRGNISPSFTLCFVNELLYLSLTYDQVLKSILVDGIML